MTITVTMASVGAATLLILLWQISAVGSFAPKCRRFFSPVLKSSSLDALFDFDRSSRIDNTIQKLREQVPLLLVRPLDRSSTSELYAESVILLGPSNEELASDLDELITLSTTLVAASSATRQASRLARSLTATSVVEPKNDSGGQEEAVDLVSSQIILDASHLDRLQVKWETTLLPSASKISGFSQLTLNDNGLISEHKLLNLKIDDQPVNAVGEALATLRRAFKSVQASPFVSLATSFPLLNGIRDELLQQAALAAAATSNVPTSSPVTLPPLFAVASLRTTNLTVDNGNDSMVLIDDFDWPSPLPGSRSWKHFANSQSVLSNFMEHSIPILSAGSPKDGLMALFSPDCTLVSTDGTSVVCSGGDTVADFYRVLASVRQGPLFGGNWNALPVDVDWKNRSVVVEYVADSPVRIQGKDRYRLSESGRIDAIEQLEIVVQGNKVEDPDWFRQFYQAVKAGRSTAGAEVVLDLIEQLGSGRKVTNAKYDDGPPKLNDAAAASVYGILRALHQDLKSLPSPTGPSVPASAYLAPSVELRGYLNEVLVRGDSSYRAAIGAFVSSFHGALQSERIVLESPPVPTLVFQPDGTIGVDLVLNLRLVPIIVVGGGGGPDLGGGLGRLKLELKFVYRVNQDGKIIEHTIVETRVNGQLTPGDVVTRLWKGTAIEGSSSPLSWPVQSVWDSLNWARAMASSS